MRACTRSGAEEIGSTTPGGEAVGVHHARIDEDAYYSREDENIIGTKHSSTTGYLHLEKSHGVYTETPVSAGQSQHAL